MTDSVATAGGVTVGCDADCAAGWDECDGGGELVVAHSVCGVPMCGVTVDKLMGHEVSSRASTIAALGLTQSRDCATSSARVSGLTAGDIEEVRPASVYHLDVITHISDWPSRDWRKHKLNNSNNNTFHTMQVSRRHPTVAIRWGVTCRVTPRPTANIDMANHNRTHVNRANDGRSDNA